jgi:DNA mismatch repair protein MutL
VSQRITILPEIITNKIAAGEVVERPASVIKELIENSLDAGATDIIVEIIAGGRRLIRITDNGHGMSREDALLSLERHATSKIRTDSDLEGISTLGFRGEALPSIASVSRFRLASREPGSAEGTEINVEGGRVRDVKACGMAPGTVISVEQLFFNTPARLKFMRSAETEAGHVADTVARMAISRPDVSFTCTSDGRELLRVQRGDLQRRLAQTLGREASANLYPVLLQKDEIGISGFLSAPATVRSTGSSIFTYINGRFVRDKVVQHAIMQAYRGVIDRGRYPVIALFIALPTGEVDVNVHPTKHEVRFRRQSIIHDLIVESLQQVLKSSPWLPRQRQTVTPPPPATGTASKAYLERIASAAQTSLNLAKKPEHVFQSNPEQGSRNTAIQFQEAATTGQPVVVSEPPEQFERTSTDTDQSRYFSSLSIIGQFHGEYILCQSDSDLIIIDQHAASERVAYQRLKKQFQAGGIESQRLLFPETVELSFGESTAAVRFLNDLTKTGFEIEPFGGNTVIISAIPRLATGRDAAMLLRDILAELTQVGSSSAFSAIQDAVLSRIACHSVVRGVRKLESRQIAELLRSMDETDFAASCPHGRPVSHIITHDELEKIFKRT